MKSSRAFSRHVVNMLLLGLCCLVLEQLGYCLFVPGYLLQLVTSAVFWGSFSVVCFSLLWWTERHSQPGKAPETPVMWNEDDYYFMYCNPLSMANPDNMFVRNWGWW